MIKDKLSFWLGIFCGCCCLLAIMLHRDAFVIIVAFLSTIINLLSSFTD